jgi:hypothetical protein
MNMVRPPRPLLLAVLAATAGFALLAAGCGGSGGSAGVATVSSSPGTTATTAPNGATTSGNTALLAYAHCMRAHGVPGFPDPDNAGRVSKVQVVAARKNDPSAFDSADGTCRHLLPNDSLGPGPQTITPAERTDYLKAAACMRTHGYPNFPDPTFPNNTVSVAIPSSIDQNSARFRAAATVCTKLIPSGLPYSRPPGQ